MIFWCFQGVEKWYIGNKWVKWKILEASAENIIIFIVFVASFEQTIIVSTFFWEHFIDQFVPRYVVMGNETVFYVF